MYTYDIILQFILQYLHKNYVGSTNKCMTSNQTYLEESTLTGLCVCGNDVIMIVALFRHANMRLKTDRDFIITVDNAEESVQLCLRLVESFSKSVCSLALETLLLKLSPVISVSCCCLQFELFAANGYKNRLEEPWKCYFDLLGDDLILLAKRF